MDFLKNMKAKLEELEREAQLAMQQQQQQSQGLFQPQIKERPPQEDSYPRGGGRQQEGKQRRSRRPIGSEECGIDVETQPRSGDNFSSRESIFEDLEGRLDEAFILQEVLGQPRCVRGWDED